MSWEQPGTEPPPRSRLSIIAGLALLATGVALVVVWRPGSSESPETIPVEQAPAAEAETDPAAVSTETAATSTPAVVGSPSPEPTPTTVPLEAGPLLGGDTGLTLAVARQGGRLWSIDADAGEATEHESGFDQVIDLLPHANMTVVVTGLSSNGVHALALPFGDGEAVALGAAERALPAADPETVWLLGGQFGVPFARQVDLSGETLVEVELPPMARLVGTVGDDLVVEAAGRLVLYDPRTGDGRGVGQGAAVAANAGHLARLTCDDALACELVLGTVENPDTTRVPMPAGLAMVGVGGASGSFSPDGRFLALQLLEAIDDRRGTLPVIVVVNTQTGEMERLGEAEGFGPFGLSPTVWAPSGDWLFYPNRSTVFAYSPGTGESTPLSLPGFLPIAALAVY